MSNGVTMKRLVEITGVNRNTLQYWKEVGLLSPCQTGSSERSDSPLRFDLRNVKIALIVARLRERGISLQKIREASNCLASHHQDLASVCLYTDGEHLYYYQPRTQMVVDLTHHPGQLSLKALFPVQDASERAEQAFQRKVIA